MVRSGISIIRMKFRKDAAYLAFHSVHHNFNWNTYGSSDSCICALEYSEEFFNSELNETTEELVTNNLPSFVSIKNIFKQARNLRE